MSTGFMFALPLTSRVPFPGCDLRACFPDLGEQGIEMPGAAVLDQDVPAGNGRSDHKGPCFDPVRKDPVVHGLQFFYALNANNISARALDLGAHLNEGLGKVDDFGLTRCVFEYCFTVSERGSHHKVLGTGNGHDIKVDLCAFQPFCLRYNIAMLDIDSSTHFLKAHDVQVYRPGSNGAAARERDPGLAKAGDERSQDQYGSPHGPDQIIGSFRICKPGGVDHRCMIGQIHGDAHISHDFRKRLHVDEVRYVRDPVLAFTKQRSGNDRKRRVLGAADRYFAFQSFTAVDYD